MSDAKDAVAEALSLARKHAARRMVARDEVAAELEELRRERAGLSGEAPLAVELDARIQAAETALAAAQVDLDAALKEVAEVQRLGHQIPAATLPAVDDPFVPSAEDIALENVRDHLRDLEAQVRLSSELGEAPPAAPPAPTREEADAAALAEFEALRARRDKKE